MAYLSENTLERIESAVRAAESKSRCEIVAVFAARSDDYQYIPLLWAALGALLLPAAVVTGFGLRMPVVDYTLVQAVLFAATAILFRMGELRVRLVPPKVRRRRAERMVGLQFVSMGLNSAEAPPAVLFFVSFDERYVRILTNAKVPVPDEKWQKIVDTMIARIRAGELDRGMVEAVETVGTVLKESCPSAEAGDDRLPNRLILL